MASRPANWSFHEHDFYRIRNLLHSFLRQSNARCALVVDRTGQLVTVAGEAPGLDATTFASLAAADFSANDELASLIGEREFSSLVHQGETESMYLADVAKRVILVVLFDHRTSLGMIRIKSKAVVRELGEIFQDLFARLATRQAPPRLESAFVDAAESEIDRLFRDV